MASQRRKNVKKQFLQSAKVIILGLILAVGVSYAMGAWTSPPSSPPTGNTDAPVNVSAVRQTKAGEFWVKTNIPTPTGIQLQPCVAVIGGQPCPFDGGIFSAVNGSSAGLTVDRSGNVNVTGRGAFSGLLSYNNVQVANGYLKVNTLGHNPTSSTELPLPVCADKFGKFVLCPAPTVVTPLGQSKVCVAYGKYFNNNTPNYNPPIGYFYNSANLNTSSISACKDWVSTNFIWYVPTSGSFSVSSMVSLACTDPSNLNTMPSPSSTAVSYVNMGGLFPVSEYINPSSLTLPNPNCGW